MLLQLVKEEMLDNLDSRWGVGVAGYKNNLWVCQINKSPLGIVFFLAAEKTTAIILVHRRQERPIGSKGGKVGKAKVAFTLVDEKWWKIRLGGR